MRSSMALMAWASSRISRQRFSRLPPYSSVRWLGYAEIVLGLVDSCMEGYGLVFWTLGFGVLHIVYGIAFCLLNPKK